jgi:radical SAM superfamily enzyme YgiQ (UPF0313 family)
VLGRSRRPNVVGISCIHTLDVPASIELARRVRRAAPRAVVVAGGHAASASPESFDAAAFDAIAIGAGERSFVRLVEAIERGGAPLEVEGFVAAGGPNATANDDIDPTLLPARQLVAPYRRHYRCVHRAPVWVVETARGCPFRCTFCAVGGSPPRLRDLGTVVEDFSRVGPDVFVVDDLFFHPRDRSLELARALERRGVRKDWLLVQTRTDTVARSVAALEAWKSRAERLDLFMGFEAASDSELKSLGKDATLRDAEEAVRIGRRLGVGITGNFVVDPDWTEADFERLWTTLDRLSLDRVGFTVLTPLPSTRLWNDAHHRLVERDFGRWDMHHVLWEPRLGRRRFYELMVESWKHNVLASRHAPRRWLSWFRGLGPRDALALAGVLWRTQRLLSVKAHLSDTFAAWPSVPSE